MDDNAEADPLKELAAMKALHQALLPLSPEGRGRAIAWAIGALDVPHSMKGAGGSRKNTDQNTYSDDSEDDGAAPDTGRKAVGFTVFADLLGEAQPQTDADKALVGGYWFQVVDGVEDFTSQAVNDKLKDTGEAVGNITRAMDKLKDSKPQLVRQLLKSGKSQQARKKFKLTTAGIQAVERMLKVEG
jgi:hypothetical protein